MKRTFAFVVLLTALGFMVKLASKEHGLASTKPKQRVATASTVGSEGPGSEGDAEALVLSRYASRTDREFVKRMLEHYHQTAVAIERTDGLRGLKLLEMLDLEAIYLYEKHPRDFCRLRDTLNDSAAADLLLHWKAYFGDKRSDDGDRDVLIAETARLSPSARRAAARYPTALPLILADPIGMTELIERRSGEPDELQDALTILSFISLEAGATDLRSGLQTLENYGSLGIDAFRLRGLEGFALVSLYGQVIEAVGGALTLDDVLLLLRVNTDDLDDLLRTHSAETVAAQLRHVGAVGLVAEVGGSPHGLRLVFEHGSIGERALRQAGPDAADLVYEVFADQTLRNQAVAAIAAHGAMALAMLDKYAVDADFRQILRSYGPAVIPPIAASDPAPETLAFLRSKQSKSFSESMAQGILSVSNENGQATIRTIQKDGIDRVSELQKTDVRFQEFLPLYDLIHLGNVARRGQSPTTGEMTWALFDGAFVVMDALSLLTVQPEGVVASELARSELKTTVRGAGKTIGRELVEGTVETAGKSALRETADDAGKRLAKWWAVRAAGGTYEVLRKLPRAMGKLGLDDIAKLGKPLCQKAGLRLTEWTPVRFLVGGVERVQKIPMRRGVKYVGIQFAQAGVGVIGFKKMEEYLASRRAE